jgi:hypothetical protein
MTDANKNQKGHRNEGLGPTLFADLFIILDDT